MSSASMEATSSGISGCPAASAIALILSRGKIAYLLSSYNFLSSDIADNSTRDLVNRENEIFFDHKQHLAAIVKVLHCGKVDKEIMISFDLENV